MNKFRKSAALDLWGIFFHRFGLAADAEPWELETTPSRQLWYYGRLRVKERALEYVWLFYVKFIWNSLFQWIEVQGNRNIELR